MADRDFPHASVLEGLRFTAQVAVPNVIQGLFRRRRIATAAASKAGTDGRAVGFIAGLKRSYGDGPLWIRVAKDEALLALGSDAIRHALEGAPDPYAADAEPKKSAMEKFQPDALTISRGEDWADRRRFTEAVLDTGKPVHRLADRFEKTSELEAGALPREVDWETWNRAVRRVTRRVVLGDGAADDDSLSEMLGELMDKANPPGKGSPELYERYSEKLAGYIDAADPASLVGLISDAPKTERTKPEHQVTHWLFALGDTLAINAFRCLALLASHDDEGAKAIGDPSRLGPCLEEAMRLWPTTAMLARETVRDTEWDGVDVPAGSQILIVNTFNHRDSDAVAFADEFAPEQWISGGAAEDWTFNHFSHGPQGCPGAQLAMLVGTTMIGKLLRDREPRLIEPRLDPSKPLPHALDYFSIRFELT